jgi:hypothetical protein
MPVVYKVLPMCLELSVTYVSGSYQRVRGEGVTRFHPHLMLLYSMKVYPNNIHKLQYLFRFLVDESSHQNQPRVLLGLFRNQLPNYHH